MRYCHKMTRVQTICKNKKYLYIKMALDSEVVDVEIKFLITIKLLFDAFMTKFPKVEPMIHLL